jgi:hypothetical protein
MAAAAHMIMDRARARAAVHGDQLTNETNLGPPMATLQKIRVCLGRAPA